MAQFITLKTGEDGRSIAVNVDAITYLEPLEHREGTTVHFGGERTLTVHNPMAYIVLESARAARDAAREMARDASRDQIRPIVDPPRR